MNVLTIFDQRITSIFEDGAPGTSLPFSFKRLARRSVREMEDETFVIDGVDTAPALYTVLVSEADDALMRPLYVRITEELSQLIEAQAKKRGYTFVGKPLVRFMVDPALRAGRFSVFAENIDPRTLARLRDEENAYLGITPPRDMYANQGFAPAQVPVHEEEPAPVAQEVAFVDAPQDEFVDDVLPEEELDAPDPLTVIPEDYVAEMAEELAEEEAPTPRHAAHLSPAEEEVEPEQPSCTLFDIGSGKTYHITSSVATIGRERMTGSVVLTDPNVSRRHAKIEYVDSGWVVSDLNSTNGTLVNDIDVDEALLHEGDVLTIGLTNLEFRAG